MARIKIKGQREMQAGLSAFSRNFAAKIPKALVAEQKINLIEVRGRTPEDTGDLKRSERVLEPEVRGNTTKVEIAAGNDEVNYAFKVHEDLDAEHPRGGQAKYLESVLMEARPFMRQRLARRLKISPEDL